MINVLLGKYKHLIDFEDNMQKNNYKWVEGYIRFQKRKNRAGWEDDCIELLVDAIDLQMEFLIDINLTKKRFDKHQK
ncbi:hypothetical protein X915_gp087 [Bacillus phage vB_BanS-Tsamsa]|uniref:Uncharacterized protein n=1 Tax=Bacillus phage vB_BanS-Tsamsa TaxID=1308863 RepID=U5J9H6_9CAUD|nr:hypothetical protein X915_gp087 [Bacillus phage vB_BanS-Tsamsa]AGI11917.1 hypothetical protein [Bacillus phage vB_BanS-Tsamsa]